MWLCLSRDWCSVGDEVCRELVVRMGSVCDDFWLLPRDEALLPLSNACCVRLTSSAFLECHVVLTKFLIWRQARLCPSRFPFSFI